MKTDRRGFLTTTLTALAAAAAFATGATAEAAPVGQLTPAACPQCGEIGATALIRKAHQMYEHDGVPMWTGQMFTAAEVQKAVAAARAEGYERREFIEAKRAESRGTYLQILNEDGSLKAEYPTLTFEAMQDDCEARGCNLVANTITSDDSPREIVHIGPLMFSHYDYAGDTYDNVLTRVDAWRRGLHRD